MLFQKDTLKYDLCRFQISLGGQMFLKYEMTIEAMCVNNSGFYDFWSQKGANDEKQLLILIWLTD